VFVHRPDIDRRARMLAPQPEEQQQWT
jgi:hypothetical protein